MKTSDTIFAFGAGKRLKKWVICGLGGADGIFLIYKHKRNVGVYFGDSVLTFNLLLVEAESAKYDEKTRFLFNSSLIYSKG